MKGSWFYMYVSMCFKLMSKVVKYRQNVDYDDQWCQTRQNSGGVGEVTKINATIWVNYKKGPLSSFFTQND